MRKVVTIIIPVYNVEKYIGKCLDSIINQTYRDLEIVVVDDGSTDQSGVICDAFAEKDSRIHVLHQKNGGLSAARNAGLDHATGEFVMFIDGDDYIHCKMAEILLKSLEENNADIAVGKFTLVKETELLNMPDEPEQRDEPKCISGRESCKLIYETEPTETIIVCNKMFRSKLFMKIRFPIGRLHEDEFVIYKLLYNSTWVTYTGVVLYYYIRRENSITMDINYSIGHMSLLDMAEESIAFFKVNNDAQMISLASDRALGLGRMLYNRYGEAGKKDMQKKILKWYRIMVRHNLSRIDCDWSSKVILWSFGISPRLTNLLSTIKGWLWKKRHQKSL